jgi:hypothetical protein
MAAAMQGHGSAPETVADDDAATPATGDPLPANPDAYDSPRASQARARGLAAPYIAGGLDPDPEAGRREDRRYLRLLIAMVVVVILAGFVLGIIANALGLPGLLGNP